MTDNQRKAYEWAKEHSDYRSKGARCAQELVGFIDNLVASGVITLERKGGDGKC